MRAGNFFKLASSSRATKDHLSCLHIILSNVALKVIQRHAGNGGVGLNRTHGRQEDETARCSVAGQGGPVGAECFKQVNRKRGTKKHG